MKFLLVFILSLPFLAHAESGYDEDIRECLSHWKNAPFDKNRLNYRKISSSVNVFGAGGDVVDKVPTKKPELVLIKPAVNVLGKSKIKLLNPQGWYCLKSNTNVLGKAVIQLHCKAKLAISSTGATVLGSNEGEQQGTTVLGKTKIERVGCD